MKLRGSVPIEKQRFSLECPARLENLSANRNQVQLLLVLEGYGLELTFSRAEADMLRQGLDTICDHGGVTGFSFPERPNQDE